MCSIFGMIFTKTNTVKTNVIQHILTEMTLNSRCRGTDATGLVFVSNKEASIIKHNISADKFIKTEEYKNELDKFVNELDVESLYSIIGHCRAQTKGTHRNNDNNHPIEVNSIIGVHNGHITNDDELFKEYKLDRIAEVDSEIIFSLIDHYTTMYKQSITEDSPTTEAIKTAVSKLSGGFACSLVDVTNPQVIWLFRNYNPIIIMHFKKEGLILFASTITILQKATELTDLSNPEMIMLDSNEGICINLKSLSYNIFSLNEKLDISKYDYQELCRDYYCD